MSVSVILTVVIAASAVLTIVAREREIRRLLLLFKPTTTLLIIALALRSAPEVWTPYAYWVLAGLLFGLFGDVFLMFPDWTFKHGLVGFLIGHAFYVFAFTSGVGFGMPVLILVLIAVYGAVVLSFLLPHLKSMTVPVLIYILVICFMALQAWARWQRLGGGRTLAAALGASFFLVSDGTLALNRFRKPFPRAHTMSLSTYYLAQWMIALSVGQAY